MHRDRSAWIGVVRWHFLHDVLRALSIVYGSVCDGRGGRRSDEGLLVMKGVNESPVLRAGLVEERASHSPEELRKSAVHGLSPIGEEKEPRAVAAADSSLTERAPLLRVDRQNPAQRVSRPLGVSSGVTIANGSAAPARPAGVPSLKLNGVGPAVPAMSLSAREASGKWQENGDGSSSARTVPDGSMMKDWLMMPTYTDTPRTTRSTLEQIPADNGFFSPRSSAGGTVPDAQEESPTVLPLHDEPDADRAWPLSNWQQQVRRVLVRVEFPTGSPISSSRRGGSREAETEQQRQRHRHRDMRKIPVLLPFTFPHLPLQPSSYQNSPSWREEHVGGFFTPIYTHTHCYLHTHNVHSTLEFASPSSLPICMRQVNGTTEWAASLLTPRR